MQAASPAAKMRRLEATPTPGPGPAPGQGMTPPTAPVRVENSLASAASYSHNRQAHLEEGVALTIRRLQQHYDLDTEFWFDHRNSALPADDNEASWGYGAFRRVVHKYVRLEDERRQERRDVGTPNPEPELGHTHEVEIVCLLLRVVEFKMKAAVNQLALQDPQAQVDALRAVAPGIWKQTEAMIPAASFTLEKIASGVTVQLLTNKKERVYEAEILDAVGWCVCSPSCEDLMTMILTACGRFDDDIAADAVRRWQAVFKRTVDKRMLFYTAAEISIAVLCATLGDRGDLHLDELHWVINLAKSNELKIDGLIRFLGSV